MSAGPPDIYLHVIDSPVGPLSLAVRKSGGIMGIRFGRHTDWPGTGRVEPNKYACGELALQLSQYFAGERRQFDLPLALTGTAFQMAVWDALRRVPWGSVISYSDLARKIGARGAARAVATAVALNPVPILIPCHRVILRSGATGNYATRYVSQEEGMRMKRILLENEGVSLAGSGRPLILLRGC